MTVAAPCPVVARIRDVAARHAERTAVVRAGECLSYAELWHSVGLWAKRCDHVGLPPRSPVVIVSDGHLDLPAAFLGVRAAGLVPVLVDGLLPAARVAATVTAARPAAVIRLNDTEPEVVPTAEPRTLPEGTGYVAFSSGSQGTPKGIAGQAAGLLHFLDWEIGRLGLTPGTRTAMLTSPSFDVVLRDLLLPLLAGGELHIAESRVRSAPGLVLPWLAEHAVAVAHVVPSLSARWLAAADCSLPALRWTLFAGEPLYDRHVTRWRSVAPNSRVLNLYGPSETTLAKFCYELPAAPAPGLQPVGRPLPGTEVELEPVTGPGGEVTAHSVTIGTPHGSFGYLTDTCSAADEQRLRRTDGRTRFRTQDRGRFTADGDLVVLGRLDSLVKRHGTFVDLANIETAAAALPNVRAACCVQLAPSGRLVLVVEGPDQAAATGFRRPLSPRLGTELPDEIRALPALPRLPSGKVDRAALRALLTEQDD